MSKLWAPTFNLRMFSVKTTEITEYYCDSTDGVVEFPYELTSNPVLQQKWICMSTGEEQWRAIERVVEDRT